MPTKVAFRVFYIELIICGFLAWVLVARNLCLSETGAPISCPVFRHGNATAKGASDGETSGSKVKGQSEGEVVNMGGRRRNVKIEKRFKPLFIVSKDRSRPKAPGTSVTDDRKSRLQTEKNMPGKNLMEPELSVEGPVDEKSEVMQSRGQHPDAQGVYEFLDMFQVSDWLSEKRRQKGEAAPRAGSEEREVDSKTEWYASKVEQDDEAENSFKMKRQHADSKDEDANSEEEVFRSFINKAKPVRIKATIVAKTIVPRAKLFGSKSKALAANAEDVTLTAEAVISKEKPVVDPKEQSKVPNKPMINVFPSISASVVFGHRLNRTNPSKEINTDAKDLYSSKTSASSGDKEQSNTLGFSDDNSGFIANILNTIFRGDDTIETPEDFDEVDLLEAAKQDAEDEVSYELMDRLAESKVISKDVNEAKEDAKRSTEIERSTEKNETFAATAAKDRFEDAANSTEIVENHLGGEQDTSTVVQHVSIEPSESTNASEDNANVSAHGRSFGPEGESIVVSLIQGRTILGAKDSGPPNEKDTSSSPRNDSHSVVNEKEEILSAVEKEIHKRAEEMSSKSNDDIPLKRKVFQLKAADILLKTKTLMENPKDVPVKGKIIPTKGKIIPVKGNIIPMGDKDFPVKDNYIHLKAEHVHADTKSIDVKADDITAHSTDSPREAQSATENSRNIVKVVPVNINDILAIDADDIPAGVDELPGNANAMPSTVEGILNVSRKVTDRPTTAREIPMKLEKISNKANDMPAKIEGIPRKQEDLSKKANDMPEKGEGIPMKVEKLSEKANDMPVKAEGIPRKQEDLSKKANDMPEKGEGIPMKLEKLSNKANDMPEKEEGIPMKVEKLSEKANDMPVKAEGIPMKLEKLSKKANDMPEKGEGIPMKLEKLSNKANDMPEKGEGIPMKLEKLSSKANDMPEKGEGIPMKLEKLSEKANDMPVKAEGIQMKVEKLSNKANDVPVKAEGIPMKLEKLSKKANDVPVKAEVIPMKLEKLSKKANDMPAKAEGISRNEEDLSEKASDMPAKADVEYEPAPKQTLDAPTKPTNASVNENDTKSEDQKSIMDREEVKIAMFTEMGNIMSDLDYLGTLWEQLKPGMKLKNSDAVRKVLHAVADVFGLENKDSAESSGKSKPEKTAAEKLRYDVAVQRTKDDQAQMEFKDVSSRDISGGQEPRVGLRSKRSLDGLSRRRRVQATNRGQRTGRNRNWLDRKYKRLAADVFSKQDGQENEDEDEDEEIVVEEDVSKKKRDNSRLRKRMGDNEDYIFGSNPGFILSRERRDAPLDNATVETVADKAEEDAISRELANLLIEKVYNRVMKSLKTPNQPETEAAQTSSKPSDMYEDEESERRRRKAGGDLRRSKRYTDDIDVGSYCRMLRTHPMKVPDQSGEKTDLYTQAVNAGICLEFEMARVAEHEVAKRESPTLAEDTVEKDERDEEMEEVERGTALEVEGKTKRQASAEANGEVRNEVERVIQRETEGETQILAQGEEAYAEVNNEAEREARGENQELAQKEANREVKNEAERVILREARGENQELAQEEANREVKNEAERVILREARGENQELSQEEANREVKNEAERVIQREVKGETQLLAQGEDKRREVKNEAEGVIQREAKEETQRLFQKEDNREVNNEVERSIDRKFRMQVYGETQKQAENEAKSETEAEEKMDAKEKEESEVEQMARETRYEDSNKVADNNIVQFGNDKWDFAKDEFRGDFDEEKRSAEEHVNQKKDLKGRRRSGVNDKSERERDDFMNYMNLKSGEADDKDFEGQ